MSTVNFDAEKLRLEQARYRTEVWKWIIIAVGAVTSFIVIDVGKLRLEESRAKAEDRRELLSAYLTATESPQPEVWRRKLQLIYNSAQDENTRKWVHLQWNYINDYAELDALYRETLKAASQLVDPDRITEPGRVQARVRYNQLYWADLPFARESTEVSKAMVEFRNQLLIAEGATSNATGLKEWEKLNLQLLQLSRVLKASMPPMELDPTQPKPAG